MSLVVNIRRYFDFSNGLRKGTRNDKRFSSLELVRGAGMIFIVLEHLLDYFIGGDSLTGVGNFSYEVNAVNIIRIITHNCSPLFLLISGITLGLIGSKKSKLDFSKFLITRGIWLIFLECTFVFIGKNQGVHYANSGSMIVWGLGFSMVLLSIAIYLHHWLQLFLAIAGIIVVQYLFVDDASAGFLWTIPAGGLSVNYLLNHFLYPILSFFSTMLIGYRISFWYLNKDDKKRKTLLLNSSLACITVLIICSLIKWILNTHNTGIALQTFVNSFFNRYPVSFGSTLFFLAPTLLALSLTESSSNWFANGFRVVGRVPMCYFYIVHIYYIHLVSVITMQLAFYRWSFDKFANRIYVTPLFENPKTNFYFVLVAWVLISILLYFLCDWYYKHKKRYKSLIDVPFQGDLADDFET
jgi:uncharacterized membrane protein